MHELTFDELITNANNNHDNVATIGWIFAILITSGELPSGPLRMWKKKHPPSNGSGLRYVSFSVRATVREKLGADWCARAVGLLLASAPQPSSAAWFPLGDLTPGRHTQHVTSTHVCVGVDQRCSDGLTVNYFMMVTFDAHVSVYLSANAWPSNICFCNADPRSKHEQWPQTGPESDICWSAPELGWGLLNLFPFYYVLSFQKHQITRCIMNVTFIFDMCRRSLAVVTRVKYECDSKNPAGTFCKIENCPNQLTEN